MNKIRSISEKLAFISAILYVAMLPYEMLYATIAIYPLIFFSVVALTKEKLKTVPKQAIIFMGIFLLGLVGYTYSNDTWRASYLLERQLVIFIFPLLLPLAAPINKKNNHIFLSALTISCIGALIYLFYVCFSKIPTGQINWKSLSNPKIFNHAFSRPIDIHASYLSLYVSLSILFLINLSTKAKLLYKILYLTAILFLSLGLFFLASRNTILSTGLAIFFLLPLFNIRNKVRFLFFATLVLGSFIIVGSQSKYIKERFSSELKGDIDLSATEHSFDNPEPRIMRWECAWDLIKKRPMLGYGTGDEMPLMMNEYKKRGMLVSLREQFNTHNEYLSVLLKFGIIGLILFISMLVYFFYLAIKAKSFIYLSFLVVLSIGFLTENIIDANKGIFYFAFFNTTLGYYALYKIKRSSHLQTSIL